MVQLSYVRNKSAETGAEPCKFVRGVAHEHGGVGLSSESLDCCRASGD